MQAKNKEKTELYRLMVRIRAFEEQSFVSFNKGLTHGVLHLYIGEEAIAAGCIYDLRKEDYIASTHRGHGHVLAKGADMGRMFAELLGKETGYCRGRGGSMHIADLSLGILGANGVVGGGIPIAAGAAFAMQAKTIATMTIPNTIIFRRNIAASFSLLGFIDRLPVAGKHHPVAMGSQNHIARRCRP